MAAVDFATSYLARGWNPVPVAFRDKKPVGKAWQRLRVSKDNVAQHFKSAQMNVGIQLGPNSGGLTDIDLDSSEAVAIAPSLLPDTACIFGRASKRASHRLYVTTMGDRINKAAIQSKDPTSESKVPPCERETFKGMLLEVRIGGGVKGAQTLAPGSVHPSGEGIDYEPARDGEPARIDGEYLLVCAKQVSAASLAARYWPGDGARHDARLAFAGLLVLAGIDQERAIAIIEATANAAGDRDIADARSAVKSTFEKRESGGAVTGLSFARDVFTDRVATRMAEWLGCHADGASAKRQLDEAEAEARIAELSKLSPIAYARIRSKEAKEIGVPPIELDKLVKAKRRATGMQYDSAGAGRPVEFLEVEPWGEEVSGAALLDRLAVRLQDYVVMSPVQADAVALWVIHTHSHDASDTSPKLIIKSPQKRSGKTRLVEVLARVVARPLFTSGITASALLRLIEKYRPTVLLDEIDAAMKANKEMAEALRGLMNSGFDCAGARYIMNVPAPDGGYEPREFSTWAPQLLCGIGNLPDTVRDRGIEIEMKRKLPREKVLRLRRRDGSDLEELARKAVRWSADNFDKLRLANPDTPDGLSDRASDAWEPLFAIADLAGGVWPQRARAAALALSGDGAAEEENFDMIPLADIRRAFDEKNIDKLASRELTSYLTSLDERTWSEWRNDKPISMAQLSHVLKRYRIGSGTIRFEGGMTAKGYYTWFTP